jgi:hypothetical protein
MQRSRKAAFKHIHHRLSDKEKPLRYVGERRRSSGEGSLMWVVTLPMIFRGKSVAKVHRRSEVYRSSGTKGLI